MGIVEPDAAGPLMGLRSWLFFLDLVARGPVVTVDLSGGRVGEPSPEGWRAVAAEVGVDRCCKTDVVDARLSVGDKEEGLRSVVPGSEPWLPLKSSVLSALLLGLCAEEAMDCDLTAKKNHTSSN